jgi:SRSO17 transposase
MSTPIETTAVMDLTPCDLDALVEELRAYHAIYSPLFQRREQREWAGKCVHGLLWDLPRKSIEPLVLAVEGVQPQAVRAMQQFTSEGSWDDTALLHRHWQ